MLEIDNIINSFLALKNYCEREQFKGWDPWVELQSISSIAIVEKVGIMQIGSDTGL